MLKQAVAAAFFAALVVAQEFVINTPSGVTACQPTLLTWSGGTPPYFLDILDGDNLSGGTVENLLTSSSVTQYTWKVNLDPGFNAVAQIRDSTGLTKTTAPFPINAGADKSCLGGSSSSSSSGSSSSAASTSSGSSASSSKPVSPSTSFTAPTTPASTTAASTTPSSSATPTTPGSSTPSTSTPSTSTPGSSTTPTSATSPANSPSSTGAALGQTVPVAGVLAALAAVLFV